MLEAVPLDPYDGQPLRYRRLADGIAVYSIGKNGVDDGGDTTNAGNPHGTDEGVRLWDVSERGKKADRNEPPPDGQ